MIVTLLSIKMEEVRGRIVRVWERIRGGGRGQGRGKGRGRERPLQNPRRFAYERVVVKIVCSFEILSLVFKIMPKLLSKILWRLRSFPSPGQKDVSLWVLPTTHTLDRGQVSAPSAYYCRVTNEQRKKDSFKKNCHLCRLQRGCWVMGAHWKSVCVFACQMKMKVKTEGKTE